MIQLLRGTFLLGLSVALGCVSFDSVEDLFICEADEDCTDEYVCAGHTFDDRTPVSYCVPEGEATVGIALFAGRDMFNCETFPVAGDELVGVQYKVATASIDTDWMAGADMPSEVVQSCDNDDSVLNGGEQPCCFGMSDPRGKGRYICVAPKGDTTHMAMWVQYTCLAAGPGCASAGDVLLTAFAGGAIPSDAATLLDETVRTYDLDVAESGNPTTMQSSARCAGRASSRESLCNASTPISCSCATPDPDNSQGLCPPTYFCTGSGAGCWPDGWADTTVLCDAASQNICASHACGAASKCTG